MRSHFLVIALSPAVALASPRQFSINVGETAVRPLDLTTLNANSLSPIYDSISSIEQWNINKGPSQNATSNLIFDTVHSLLQHWPNTRYRHGHNIVPGVIPIGTLLYHGTHRDTIPTGPDWVATDPEHSIIFSRGIDGCGWQLTLTTTRPLKVLYFDGSSAAKLPEGTMDTQDIIAWGEILPDQYRNEQKRITNLCTWGKEFGIDGFARMEMDFEVMLCDFKAGVSLVSFLNIVTPKERTREYPDRDVPPMTKGHPQHDVPPIDSDFLIRSFEVIHAGSWHNRYPGESRIVLDLTGLVSLYDTALAPSLIPVRAGLERYDHRVLGISSEDISHVLRTLTDIVSRPDPVGSGIDWKTLIHVIVNRYADRLELMQNLLNFTSSDSQELLQRAKLVQAQLRVMLTPYLLYSTVVPVSASDVNATQWAYPIFKECASTHTSEMMTHIPSMTSSERLLLKAVQETTREICRVTTKLWAQGVTSGLDTLFKVELDRQPEVGRLIDGWKDDIQKLMSWLDWSIWIKCRPACGPEEMCYLPTWPFHTPFPGEPPRDPTDGVPEEMRFAAPPWRLAIAHMLPFFGTRAEEDWSKPHPKCIRRIQPYTT